MNRTRLIVTILLAAMAFTFTACEKPKWDDPTYVNTKLQDEDRNTRSLAMSNLSQLKKEDIQKIVPGLIHVYKTDPVLRKDAMNQLLQAHSPAAKDIYLEELKTNESDYANNAAAVLGDLGDPSLAVPMINIYHSADNNLIKMSILHALINLPNPKMIPPLIDTLKLDVDRNPIALLAYSCNILTEIAAKDNSQFSDADIKQITMAMFFANRTSQTLDRDCGMTVQALGDRAIPELMKIYRGEREDIKKLFMKYDTQDTPYPPNLAKLVAVQRLTGLRAKEFGSVIIEDLKSTKAAPKQFTGMGAVNWRMKEGMATSEELYALGDIPTPGGVEMLEAVVKGEYIHKEWDDITDRLVELQFRQDASFGMVRLGDRSALPTLLDMAKNGVIPDMEKTAEILAKRGQPVKDIERWQMNWMLAQSYADLAMAKNRPDYEKLIEETKKKSKELADKMSEFLIMFDVAKECEAKGNEKAIAECYGQKVLDDNELVREKAAWELGRLPAEVAAPVINNVYPKCDYLATREFLSVDLYKVGNRDSIKMIEKLLKDEESRGAKFGLDHYRLKMARLWLLKHR